MSDAFTKYRRSAAIGSMQSQVTEGHTLRVFKQVFQDDFRVTEDVQDVITNNPMNSTYRIHLRTNVLSKPVVSPFHCSRLLDMHHQHVSTDAWLRLLTCCPLNLVKRALVGIHVSLMLHFAATGCSLAGVWQTAKACIPQVLQSVSALQCAVQIDRVTFDVIGLEYRVSLADPLALPRQAIINDLTVTLSADAVHVKSAAAGGGHQLNIEVILNSMVRCFLASC